MKRTEEKKRLRCRRRKGKKHHYVSPDEVGRMMINAELKPYKVDFDYIMANQKIEGNDWWYYYTFNNEEDYQKWKKYCINLIMTKLNYTEYYAIRQFGMFDLCYGLRHNYEKEKYE